MIVSSKCSPVSHRVSIVRLETNTITSHEHGPLPLLSDSGHTDTGFVDKTKPHGLFFRIIFFQNCPLLDSNPSRVRLR